MHIYGFTNMCLPESLEDYIEWHHSEMDIYIVLPKDMDRDILATIAVAIHDFSEGISNDG